MKFRAAYVAVPALVVSVALLATPARGAWVQMYTGNAFTFVNDETPPAGTYDTSMSIDASFTFGSALAPNLLTEDVAASVLTFSVSDDRNTLTDGTGANIAFFTVSTDAVGTITEWNFGVSLGDPLMSVGDQSFAISSNSTQFDLAVILECTVSPCGFGGSVNADFALAPPGTWAGTEVAVPEPSALALFAIGLVGLGFLGWRRRRRAGRRRNVAASGFC